MNGMEDALRLALECGFTRAGAIAPEHMEFQPAVREMCAADRCREYGRNWSCPPACGTLEELRGRASGFQAGILMQTTGPLEDSFDVESMRALEVRHQESFRQLAVRLEEAHQETFPMGAGVCRRCEGCTYPEAPCRFPETCWPSMEACGLLVSRECQRCGLPYYYGPNTMTYVSCILFHSPEKIIRSM